MKSYTFTGPKGCTPTTVLARNEAEARHLAMVKRWGPPGLSGDKIVPDMIYKGEGLDLVRVKND